MPAPTIEPMPMNAAPRTDIFPGLPPASALPPGAAGPAAASDMTSTPALGRVRARSAATEHLVHLDRYWQRQREEQAGHPLAAAERQRVQQALEEADLGGEHHHDNWHDGKQQRLEERRLPGRRIAGAEDQRPPGGAEADHGEAHGDRDGGRIERWFTRSTEDGGEAAHAKDQAEDDPVNDVRSVGDL